MGSRSNTEPWVKPFREQVHISCAEGWNVLNSRGRMRLQVKGVGSVVLPYHWSAQGSASALPRIQQIFKHWSFGNSTLSDAARRSSTSSSSQVIDFPSLFDEFKISHVNANDTTWKDHYLPVLNNCSALFLSSPPVDGSELCVKALSQWKQGTRMRQISRQKLYSFLNWAVFRGHLKSIYLPPIHLVETLNPKRVGFALSDNQILDLLNSLLCDGVHVKWKFAIQLCAVYGLRPEELRYLRLKDGAKGREIWSIYRKSMGGKKGSRTQPRRLFPLFVHGQSGKSFNWNLEDRLCLNESLPPLNRVGDGGNALNQYLRRRPFWMELRNKVSSLGEHLTPYSFRHRYAKISHARNIPVSNIAFAMGHTIEVHL